MTPIALVTLFEEIRRLWLGESDCLVHILLNNHVYVLGTYKLWIYYESGLSIISEQGVRHFDRRSLCIISRECINIDDLILTLFVDISSSQLFVDDYASGQHKYAWDLLEK